MRKTIEISLIKDDVNNFLFNSVDSDQASRETMMVFLEHWLMEVGAYKGFAYLTKEHMKDSNSGTTFGIDNGSFDNTDYTRVYYY